LDEGPAAGARGIGPRRRGFGILAGTMPVTPVAPPAGIGPDMTIDSGPEPQAHQVALQSAFQVCRQD